MQHGSKGPFFLTEHLVIVNILRIYFENLEKFKLHIAHYIDGTLVVIPAFCNLNPNPYFPPPGSSPSLLDCQLSPSQTVDEGKCLSSFTFASDVLIDETECRANLNN